MIEVLKEYAEALFTLALEKKKVKEFSKNLDFLKTTFIENASYLEFLSSPAIPLSERLSALNGAFSSCLEEEVLICLELLCKKGRINGIFSFIEAFFDLKTASENTSVAKVYYAVELTDEQKSALSSTLEKKTGKNVEIVFIEDKSLIGGIKVLLDDKVFDGSVSHHLKDIKGVINK